MTDADLYEGMDAAPRGTLPQPALAYDYFKNMASVSVATLGGILTLGETVFGGRIAPWQMGLPALLVAASGLLALQAKTDIVQLGQGMKPRRDSSRLALRVVPSLYGLGLGIFLALLSLSYVNSLPNTAASQPVIGASADRSRLAAPAPAARP